MFKRILVPTDGSKQAEIAAQAAVDLAALSGGSVVALHVVPSYDDAAYRTVALSPGWVTEKEFDKLNQRAAKKFLGNVEKLAQAAGVSYDGCTVKGIHTANAIVEIAESKGCDLICMGSHGRGGLAQFLLGSVTSKVLSLCSLPVLVHRKGGRKAHTKSRSSAASRAHAPAPASPES
jgi:nucleotide-binding universal stress UspA family protein